MTTLRIGTSISRWPLRRGFTVIALVLACFALSPTPKAFGFLNPPPDGGYPGENTAEGDGALFSLTTGTDNTANGTFALQANTTGSGNIALGDRAGFNLTTGSNNIDIGNFGLNGESDTIRIGATQTTTFIAGISGDATFQPNRVVVVNGDGQLASVDVSIFLDASLPGGNTAEGDGALHDLTTGRNDTAMGFNALFNNTTGHANTAMGSQALAFNNTGFDNTAIGFQALSSNTDSAFNTAIGRDSLLLNTTGDGNTGVGYGALSGNTTGVLNTALGFFAGWGVHTAFNVICIGSLGEDVSNSTWINNVYGITPQSGNTAPVVVSDGGQLGTEASSERFKKDIVAMDKISETILSLRPVAFHYRSDTKETPQFGLIAEEVAKVNPALVLPDKEGKPYTVRYDAVNAMLLNEFLKEHRKVQELEANAVRQQKQIEALTAGLQKVNAQIELNKRAPQTVLNNQ